MPNTSGEICLNANNCNFATQAQLAQIQPVAGVTALNDLAGGVTVQGSLNQITVTTAGGVVTLSTPQDLDANANVQFGGLTVGGLGTGPLRATNGSLVVGTINLGSGDVTGITGVANGGTGVNTLTANGVLVGNGTSPITAVSSGGAGLCLVSTVGAPTFQACPGGGGVSSVNSLTGALTLQGTTNQINVASGGTTITLSTPQDIATSSSPTFAGLTSPSLQSSAALTFTSNAGGDIILNSADTIELQDNANITGTLNVTADTDVAGRMAVGDNAAPLSVATLSLGEIHSGTNCGAFGCYGIIAVTTADSVTGTNTGISGIYSRVDVSAGTLDRANAVSAANAAGAGTVLNNYGLFVENMTKGTNNDYGVYIQGADTYALFVDAGATRLDGTLELQTLGVTDTATHLCRNSSNQLAACNATGAGAVFVQGGNNFGGTGTLGLTSNNDLNVITNNATRLSITGAGATTVTGGATGNPVALTVNNSTSTNSILVLQDNGSPVFTVADGGNITSTADLAVNGGDITSSAGPP